LVLFDYWYYPQGLGWHNRKPRTIDWKKVGLIPIDTRGIIDTSAGISSCMTFCYGDLLKSLRKEVMGLENEP
jgi:hypothetical protein